MSKTAVDTEPLKWPIAPDGYIPNSVIRSWMRKGKELIKKDCWHDNITSHQSQEVGSTYSSRKTVNFTPTSCHENRPKQLRELREDMKLHETITPPLSVPNKQRTSSFIFNECPATPVASPVVSADTIIPKQECPATPVASPVVSADTIIPKQECPATPVASPVVSADTIIPKQECPATPVASPVVSADTIIPKQECPATPVASPVVSADTIIPKQGYCHLDYILTQDNILPTTYRAKKPDSSSPKASPSNPRGSSTPTRPWAS
ncbi:myosin tail region-interacting protein MTI1-like isoform X11 [Siniperca chuatsi]|uniref:myosin tail region-interacting protein MTI1-like isoform X11 n=1 Tax=Siniperca chuatsi TaxID=119488 RepID=UPI001CE1B317|nr:myosin tail region-interacting protein MTI1-like isoform X11 [Siniperca chuatsi]